MKTRRLIIGLAALLPFAALPLLPPDASADDTQAAAMASSAGADGGAEADTDGGADADADAAPSLPAFDKELLAEASPRPKYEEWQGAREVALSAGSSLPFDCKVQQIREWLRVRCARDTLAIVLVGGEGADVVAALDAIKEDWQRFPPSGEVSFPVRRGDRRFFEWVGVEFGYKGMTSASTLFVLSEHWLPGDEKPTILAQ